ncbi:hypothetical protein MMC10_008896 [Thelotrema lepadinum]|nr:hypothetical protein [Thelotrema lepadinum]
MSHEMDDESHLEEILDGRSSFDVQLPIQIHSRPMSRMSFNAPNYATEDSTPANNETDDEEDLIKQAQRLGLDVSGAPEEQTRPIQDVARNASAVTITSSQPAPSVAQSRASDSTRPTSYGSSERQPEQQKPPLSSLPSTTSSLKSSSRSLLSRERSDSKFRKSIRRLSTLGRRKALDTNDLLRPSLQRNHSAVSEPPRPVTADASRRDASRRSSFAPSLPPISAISNGRPSGFLHSFSEPRIAVPSRITVNYARPLTPPSEEKETEQEIRDTSSIRAAKQRSLHCGRLQRLRIAHLDEQSSFLTARYAAYCAIREKFQPTRQRIYDSSAEKQALAQSRHANMNSDLENRHLTAEMDLERALVTERKACATKVKYMEAYCYGSRNRNFTAAPPSPTEQAAATAAGMPARKVTEHDYRKLVEQYNLRNGMDQLHSARINVLREQQAKQAERIGRRQEKELDGLEAERDADLAKVEREIEQELAPIRREWEARKKKMAWRWSVKEAIERKTLEAERGEVYGELPKVVWPAEEKDEERKAFMEITLGDIKEEVQRSYELDVMSVGGEDASIVGLAVGGRGDILMTR